MVLKRPVLSIPVLSFIVSCTVAVIVSAIFCIAAPLPRSRAAATVMAMPSDRVADSYAIYSALMPGSPFDTMSSQQNLRWAIADTTVSITDMNPAVPPEGQLTAPPDNEKAFQEAVRDFEVRKYQRIQLMPVFSLPKPYDLFTDSQVNELRHARTSVAASSDMQAKYAGYPGVTFFSQVFFNAGHTAALVYMNNWCASLCAAGSWVYVEKHGSQWVRRSGITSKIS